MKGKHLIWISLMCLFPVFAVPAFAQKKAPPVAKPAKSAAQQSVAITQAEQMNLELFAAVAAGNTEAVGRMLSGGMDVNARDREGMTPLMRASIRGDAAMVSLLLSKGASVNLSDVFGVTALMQASWSGYVDVAELLIAQGADPALQSTVEIPTLRKKGVNALMGAAINGNTEVVRLLLSKDVPLNSQDAQGQTALIYASKGGHFQVVDMLLFRGAKTEIRDQFGRTALYLCLRPRSWRNLYDAQGGHVPQKPYTIGGFTQECPPAVLLKPNSLEAESIGVGTCPPLLFLRSRPFPCPPADARH
jgi:hypothetical protein